MSTMRQNLEAMATRINELADEPGRRVSREQLSQIIAALALDEDLRIIFNFAVMTGRSAKEFHDLRSHLDSDDESTPH